jgi:2-amino-4-hydroxy-6-hydroxymethyldihydropteridine diphosphokinase
LQFSGTSSAADLPQNRKPTRLQFSGTSSAADLPQNRKPTRLQFSGTSTTKARTQDPAAPVRRMTPRRAFIGLGSNLGDRRAHLTAAVEGLRRNHDVAAVSPLYETEPVGGPEDQGRYLNVVVELSTTDSPRRLLERCRALETEANRERSVRWGPRTLDADVLWVEGQEVDEPDLTVPHPRLWERRFVLAPLADLAPDLVTPAQVGAAGGEVVRMGRL